MGEVSFGGFITYEAEDLYRWCVGFIDDAGLFDGVSWRV